MKRYEKKYTCSCYFGSYPCECRTDFSDAVYGIVEGINIDISRDATLVTTGGVISLFQQNMVAVRVECEVAFGVKSASEFNLLTGDVPSA